MNEIFEQIKKKELIRALIVSVASGICLALLAAGGLLLSFKLCNVYLHAGYYVLIAFAVALVTAGAVFLWLRPTDKKLAKKLDKQFGLDEKVQTMVMYRESGEEMAVLQRKKTGEVLSSLPPKKATPFQIARLCVIPVLALALFFTGAFYPKKVEANPPPPFDITRTQIIDLTQLIEEVNASYLGEDLKEGCAQVLSNLLDGLKTEEEEKKMQLAVVSAVTLIDGMISSRNSSLAVADLLTSSDRIKSFATAATDGAFYYRIDGVRLTDFDSVAVKYDRSENGVQNVLASNIEGLLAGWKEMETAALKSDLELFLNELAPYKQASFTAEDDEFVSSLGTLERALQTIVENIASGGYPDEEIAAQLENAFNAYRLTASAALSVQSYGTMMNVYIRTRLSDIFNVPQSLFPPLALPAAGAGGSDSDSSSDNSSSGGKGDEEQIRGSNDYIYYPKEERYVPLSEVLDEYDRKITEYLRGGEVSEELAKFIQEYFDILFTQIKEENE